MSIICDVLVVGLGPAGSRAAFSAARAGMRVVALERRREPGVPVQCAELVPALLQQELADLNGYTRQAIASMDTYIEEGAREVTPHFPGAMIDRAAFDAALAAQAARAGADCRCGIALVRLEADGTALAADGARIRARAIVGADGPRSRVGRAVDRVNRELVEARQITMPLAWPHASTDIYLANAIPGGYGWLFPKGNVAHVGAGVERDARGRLPQLVAELHERLVREGRVGGCVLSRTGGAIPAGGMLEATARLGRAAVLLAGDAAGLANPVTGAGIAAAVQSGTLAGAAAASWVGGDGAALARYQEELEDIFGAALERACARRAALLNAREMGRRLSAAEQRRGWIAFPEYWAA
jgi:geranylgeranyl reductase family protein